MVTKAMQVRSSRVKGHTLLKRNPEGQLHHDLLFVSQPCLSLDNKLEHFGRHSGSFLIKRFLHDYHCCSHDHFLEVAPCWEQSASSTEYTLRTSLPPPSPLPPPFPLLSSSSSPWWPGPWASTKYCPLHHPAAFKLFFKKILHLEHRVSSFVMERAQDLD